MMTAHRKNKPISRAFAVACLACAACVSTQAVEIVDDGDGSTLPSPQIIAACRSCVEAHDKPEPGRADELAVCRANEKCGFEAVCVSSSLGGGCVPVRCLGDAGDDGG